MDRTASHTKNDPARTVNGVKDKKQLLPPFLPVLTPHILPPKPFPPQLLLHTPLFSSCLCPFSLIITSTTDRATKSGNVARKEGKYGEKVPCNPERCGSQTDCQRRCSRPWTHRQRLQKQKEYSLTKLLDPLPCDMGFPGGTSGKELTCQCRRHKRSRFNPWVGKNPWRRA